MPVEKTFLDDYMSCTFIRYDSHGRCSADVTVGFDNLSQVRQLSQWTGYQMGDWFSFEDRTMTVDEFAIMVLFDAG
jgi:hypothetical protein